MLVETQSADALRAHFDDQCERFIAWAAQELQHRAARDAALTALAFPHASFRPGQRELAEAVYRAAVAQRCLMAQAPTGIGKTVGTLFPLLKAWPGQQLDKIFFLTAKSAGRQLALDALDVRSRAATPLRVLELVARDKACEHPDRACHGESCPLARGFYDRLPAARAAALDAARLDQGRASRRSRCAHEVCPYYLSQEMSRWSDVIVGDYNYYFDTSAMLFALAEANRWRVSVLVDEAHNLVERARGMYSATLDQAAFDAMRRGAPPPLKQALGARRAKLEANCTPNRRAEYRLARTRHCPRASSTALATRDLADDGFRSPNNPTPSRPKRCASISTPCISRASPSASARIRSSTSRLAHALPLDATPTPCSACAT